MKLSYNLRRLKRI